MNNAFNELRKTYTNDELSHFPGDKNLRFKALSPILKSLFESKVVYCEKFVCVARLDDIQITPEAFKATAVPLQKIVREAGFPIYNPTEPWTFSSSWDWMCPGFNSIGVPYAGWRIWPEADLVRTVEALVREGRHKEALDLTLYAEPVDETA